MKRSIFLLCMLSILLVQCKEEPKNPLSDFESQLKEDPSPTNANKLVKEIANQISSNKGDKVKNYDLIQKGLEISNKHNLKSKSASFITMLLRNHSDKVNDKKAMVLDLAGIMTANNRVNAANILHKSVIDQYPNDPEIGKLKSSIGDLASKDIHVYMLELAETIFVDPDQFGINRKNSSEYVNACEAYALSYADEKSPEYLYKAAEIARSLRTFPKTLSIYDWIIDKYPNYEKASTTLFLKGFIIENELKNDELARATYEEFLEKYSSDDLADDVKFLLDNLGKSNEEILEVIDSKKGATGN